MAATVMSLGQSGIFVRGEHNSWGANQADELVATGNGIYEIENYTLTGAFKIADASWSSACNWGAPAGSTLVRPGEKHQLENGSNTNLTVDGETVCAKITFDANEGTLLIEKVPDAPEVLAGPALWPVNVVLTTKQPEEVKILSMNNSLIHYESECQDEMFNSMAEAMGKNANWTAHTNLGKSLEYHYNEGEGLTEAGVPGAKMMVKSEAWTHIILQEQTAKPRTKFEEYRQSVIKWVEYIRENCPNPNAIIILPVNWAYNTDPFGEFNAAMLTNYRALAQELGVTLCPVGVAYEKAYEKDATILTTWFKDDRHPKQNSTYMACCLEYATIYGADPKTITWRPTTLTDQEAEEMRQYASDTYNEFEQTVDHTKHTVRYEIHQLTDKGLSAGMIESATISANGGSADGNTFTATTEGEYTISATYGGETYTAKVNAAQPVTVVMSYPAISINADNTTVSENFDKIGGKDADPSSDPKTGIAETSALPEGWRIERNLVGPREIGRYADASETTMYIGGQALASNAYNGTWNLGATGSEDRAVGGMTTGVANGTRGINVMVHLKNDGTVKFESLDIKYDVEKYRNGSNPAGFTVQMYYSLNGKAWTSAGEAFRTVYEPDGNGDGYAEVPAETKSTDERLEIEFAAGTDLYLAWNISVTSGTTCNGAPALGIDNVSITGNTPKLPEAAHYIYVDDQSGWAITALYVYGDSELYGGWPGYYLNYTTVIDGTVYKVIPLDIEADGSYNLIFNNGNNGEQGADFNITKATDYYLTVTKEGVKNNATAIEETERDTTEQEGVWTLTGQKIRENCDTRNLPRGIYIVGGQKRMVK